MKKPRIAITMGDPAGVGPEVCLKVIENEDLLRQCEPMIVGDLRILSTVASQLGLRVPDRVVTTGEGLVSLDNDAGAPLVFDLGTICHEVKPGVVAAECGRASYRYITTAIDLALDGSIAAITTGPINKMALREAGIQFPGHTEILAERTDADHSCMMQFSDEVTAVFVTTHVGYREVPDLLTVDRILEVIELGRDAIVRMRGHEPRMVCCGLNPHAGEGGLFGEEEQTVIIPALERARKRGVNILGPLPPDTAFLPAQRKATDCFVCMYHDQGHIPLKALAFDYAVNITLGLPIIRTSVDHGTAFDIAWKGEAKVSSMTEAIKLAVKLAATRGAE